MADKSMYIQNDDTQKLCIVRLVVETFGHLMNQPIKIQQKSPKLFIQLIRKLHYETLELV